MQGNNIMRLTLNKERAVNRNLGILIFTKFRHHIKKIVYLNLLSIQVGYLEVEKKRMKNL